MRTTMHPCDVVSLLLLLCWLVQCMDHTGQQNLTAFGDTGEAIMGCKADDLADTQAIGEAAYEAMVQQRMNAVRGRPAGCMHHSCSTPGR